jgi:antitoxin (DNA-binding transcriptional repressor) of toxin-antitoxin stability system
VKNAKLALLKNNLSRHLAHVEAGGAVMVLDRDRPVVQIVPRVSTGRAGGRRQRSGDSPQAPGRDPARRRRAAGPARAAPATTASRRRAQGCPDRARERSVRFSDLVGRHAERLVETHQRGAAFAAAEDDPATLDVVTLDRQQAVAAEREGFRVPGP